MAVFSLIEVDTSALERDIQRLRQTLAQTRARIRTLKEKMNAMNSMWEGPSNAAIRLRFQDDHQRMSELCDSLEGLIRTLEAIRRAYETCENQVRAEVDALRV